MLLLLFVCGGCVQVRRSWTPLRRNTIFALFFLFPPHTVFILLSLSCWSFSLNFGGVFEDSDAQLCTFGVLGLSCETPGAPLTLPTGPPLFLGFWPPPLRAPTPKGSQPLCPPPPFRFLGTPHFGPPPFGHHFSGFGPPILSALPVGPTLPEKNWAGHDPPFTLCALVSPMTACVVMTWASSGAGGVPRIMRRHFHTSYVMTVRELLNLVGLNCRQPTS